MKKNSNSINYNGDGLNKKKLGCWNRAGRVCAHRKNLNKIGGKNDWKNMNRPTNKFSFFF